MKVYLTLCMFILMFFHNSCEKSIDDQNGCDSTMACTTIFKIISVEILNQNQQPIVLDKFEVIDISDGKDVTPINAYPIDLSHQYGNYPIAADGSVDQLQTKTLEFRGYIGNDMIVKELYTVKGGCCHIELVSGETKITIKE